MDAVQSIRAKLKENADDKIAASAVRFFKEAIQCYGIKTPMVRSLAKDEFKALKTAPKSLVLGHCEKLWQSGIHEEGLVACFWSHTIARNFESADFEILEKWIHKYVSNWALCDTFCNHTVGTILINFPTLMPRLKIWAKQENRWMKRAAAVSLIVPARQGLYLKEMLEIASILLKDEDDLVQKGYGWMLKVAAEKHPDAVFQFIMKNKIGMPRTALRYAIEKMSDEMRKKAME